MNWIKRLFGNGAATTEGSVVTEAQQNLSEACEGVLKGRTADDLLEEYRYRCGSVNQRHSWKYDGITYDVCRRCGKER